MAPLSPEAQALQKQLITRFVASAPEKRKRIEQAWDLVRQSEWSPEALAELRTLAHRLAGSAGSYGFDELGARALDLDVSLETVDASTSQRRLIERQLRGLVAALEAVEKKEARTSLGG